MSDTSDDQDRAEALDAGNLDSDDAEGELAYPPDRYLGATAYGTTPQEERIDEPIGERVAADEPEETPWDEPVGRLVEPGGEDLLDAVDDEADAVAEAWSEEDLSAEEAAVHLTEPPPMGRRGDGYIDED